MHSIGRDTLAPAIGTEAELPAGEGASAQGQTRVRVSGRARRGGGAPNVYELAQIAEYFGGLVSGEPSTKDQRDTLIAPESDIRSARARQSMGLLTELAEPPRDAFISRLLALAAEAKRRDCLTTTEITEIFDLVELEDQERTQLLGGD